MIPYIFLKDVAWISLYTERVGGQSSSNSKSGGGEVRGDYIAFWAFESTVGEEIGIFATSTMGFSLCDDCMLVQNAAWRKKPLHFGFWAENVCAVNYYCSSVGNIWT